MTRHWIEPAPQLEYHRLCVATVALARAALGRMNRNESEAMFGGRADGEDTAFKTRAAELRAAWIAAEAVVPGGGPLGRLVRLIRAGDDFVTATLLALAVAPALDRGVRRSYADLGGLTAGLLVELASTIDVHRLTLMGALHPDAALRRSGAIEAAAGNDVALAADSALAVAPSIYSVLRCEPIALPDAVDELEAPPAGGASGRALDALEVGSLALGEVACLVGGGAAVVALARLYAGARGALIWRLRLDDRVEPSWPGLLRDAALANAIVLVIGVANAAWVRRLAWAAERAAQPAICAVPGLEAMPELAAIDLARVREAGRALDARALAADDPRTAALLADVLG